MYDIDLGDVHLPDSVPSILEPVHTYCLLLCITLYSYSYSFFNNRSCCVSKDSYFCFSAFLINSSYPSLSFKNSLSGIINRIATNAIIIIIAYIIRNFF